MTAPLIAWAAVAPDHTFERVYLVVELGQQNIARFGEEHSVQRETGRWWDPLDPSEGWRHAFRAGWRVVPVEIRVKEDGNG